MRTKLRSIFQTTIPTAVLAACVVNFAGIAKAALGPVNSIQNPSFETGDLAGWQTQVITDTFGDVQVNSSGYNTDLGFFSVTPTEGNFAATTGFDGDPGTIRLFQDLVVPCGAATLTFDYRAGWNMQDFPGSTQPRHFYVLIEPSGGGSILLSNLVLSAAPGTQNADSGAQSVSIDATAVQGTAVRISFNFEIPESYTGPGFIQIDNVKMLTEVNVAPTDLSLSKSTVSENQVIGTTIGILTGEDPNTNDKLTFSLVSGAGDSDNASFTIVDNELKTAAVFDYETKTSYTIRIAASDYCGASIEEQVTISINNLEAVPGIYNGLFSEASGVNFKSAGYFTMKVGPTRRTTGKITVDGNTVPFSGTMNLDGALSVVTKRRFPVTDKPELSLTIALDEPATARLTGSIVQGGLDPWNSTILANRVTWTTAQGGQATQFSGDYTMLMPSDGSGPLGSGYLLFSVNEMGVLRAGGRLADGHAATQAVAISKDGTFPLFHRLYRQSHINLKGREIFITRGFAMGWLQLTNDNVSGNLAPVGQVHWIKTGWNNATYTTGFTNLSEVAGSRWISPASQDVRAMNLTNVIVSFSEGDLAQPFNAKYILTTGNDLEKIQPVTPTSYPNRLTADVWSRKKKGVISGSFVHPGNPSVTTRWFGAVLQNANYGEGFFMGPTVSGKVDFESAPE